MMTTQQRIGLPVVLPPFPQHNSAGDWGERSKNVMQRQE